MLRLFPFLLLGSALCSAAEAGDSASDALAGHRAEQRQWQAEQDVFRRPLFLEAVEIESPEVGLPCDHRPQSVSGTGFVVLLESVEMPPRRVRFFAAPGRAADLAEARKQAQEFAKSRLGGVITREMAARSFGWCR